MQPHSGSQDNLAVFVAFLRPGATVRSMDLSAVGHLSHGASPNIADVVTTTTYKNLRGVRGGLVLSHREDLARKLNSAVFPGVQGSVILNAVAAKAVCLGEALRPEFKAYGRAVLDNARSLAAALVERGVAVLTGGTDTPIVVADLRPSGLTGAAASDALEAAGLTANKNSVPGDPQPPQTTSGLRFGTSAGTARGLNAAAFAQVGRWIADVLEALAAGHATTVAERVRREVDDLVAQHPIY